MATGLAADSPTGGMDAYAEVHHWAAIVLQIEATMHACTCRLLTC